MYNNVFHVFIRSRYSYVHVPIITCTINDAPTRGFFPTAITWKSFHRRDYFGIWHTHTQKRAHMLRYNRFRRTWAGKSLYVFSQGLCVRTHWRRSREILEGRSQCSWYGCLIENRRNKSCYFFVLCNIFLERVQPRLLRGWNKRQISLSDNMLTLQQSERTYNLKLPWEDSCIVARPSHCTYNYNDLFCFFVCFTSVLLI